MAHFNSRLFLSLAILFGLATSSVTADWSYDFDGPAPADWTIAHNTHPVGGNSATFADSIESGYLRMQDSTRANSGGAFSGFAGVTSDVFTDVTVSAWVNVAGDTNDDLGVVTRTDPTAGTAYFASVDYELGSACVTKIKDFSVGVDLGCSPLGSLSTSDSHYLSLTSTGGATTDFVLSVFDAPGGTLLQTVNATDDGSVAGFGAAYTAGIAGAFMVPKGATVSLASLDQLNGTFDNLSAVTVPEPSTAAMVVFGLAGMMGFRRRNR